MGEDVHVRFALWRIIAVLEPGWRICAGICAKPGISLIPRSGDSVRRRLQRMVGNGDYGSWQSAVRAVANWTHAVGRIGMARSSVPISPKAIPRMSSGASLSRVLGREDDPSGSGSQLGNPDDGHDQGVLQISNLSSQDWERQKDGAPFTSGCGDKPLCSCRVDSSTSLQTLGSLTLPTLATSTRPLSSVSSKR